MLLLINKQIVAYVVQYSREYSYINYFLLKNLLIQTLKRIGTELP